MMLRSYKPSETGRTCSRVTYPSCRPSSVRPLGWPTKRWLLQWWTCLHTVTNKLIRYGLHRYQTGLSHIAYCIVHCLHVYQVSAAELLKFPNFASLPFTWKKLQLSSHIGPIAIRQLLYWIACDSQGSISTRKITKAEKCQISFSAVGHTHKMENHGTPEIFPKNL